MSGTPGISPACARAGSITSASAPRHDSAADRRQARSETFRISPSHEYEFQICRRVERAGLTKPFNRPGGAELALQLRRSGQRGIYAQSLPSEVKRTRRRAEGEFEPPSASGILEVVVAL